MLVFKRLFPTYGSSNHIYKVEQAAAKGNKYGL